MITIQEGECGGERGREDLWIAKLGFYTHDHNINVLPLIPNGLLIT